MSLHGGRGRPSVVDDDFEKHRDTIATLYEKRPLREVRQLMEDRYGFRASDKQYKSRLARWEKSKNIGRKDMPHLARIKTRRDAVGKRTRLRLRGAVVDLAKVERWIKRERAKQGEAGFAASTKATVSTPSDISVESPPASAAEPDEGDDTATCPPEICRASVMQEIESGIGILDQAFHEIDEESRNDSSTSGPHTLFQRHTSEWTAAHVGRNSPELPIPGLESKTVPKKRYKDLEISQRIAIRDELEAAIRGADVYGVRSALANVLPTNPEWRLFTIRDEVGWLRPLMIEACIHGTIPIVQLLLDYSAEVAWALDDVLSGTAPGIERDVRRTTPITEASKAGHYAVVQLLLQRYFNHWFLQSTRCVWSNEYGDVLHRPFIAALRAKQTGIAELLGLRLSDKACLLAKLCSAGKAPLMESVWRWFPDITAEQIYDEFCDIRGTFDMPGPGHPTVVPPYMPDGGRPLCVPSLPGLRKLQRAKFAEFRLRFIHQFDLLQLAARSVDGLSHLAPAVMSYRNAWSEATQTMRKLTGHFAFVRQPTARGAAAFLCVSRAVAETSPRTGNRKTYLASFEDGLRKWIHWFPELNDVVAMLWGVTVDTSSTSAPDSCSTSEELDLFFKLREAVAALVRAVHDTFGLENYRHHSGCGDRHGDKPVLPHPPDPITAQEVTRKEKPPDLDSSPRARETPHRRAAVLDLVTGIVFALVIFFILGLVRASCSTLFGLPNPWYDAATQLVAGSDGSVSAPPLPNADNKDVFGAFGPASSMSAVEALPEPSPPWTFPDLPADLWYGSSTFSIAPSASKSSTPPREPPVQPLESSSPLAANPPVPTGIGDEDVVVPWQTDSPGLPGIEMPDFSTDWEIWELFAT